MSLRFKTIIGILLIQILALVVVVWSNLDLLMSSGDQLIREQTKAVSTLAADHVWRVYRESPTQVPATIAGIRLADPRIESIAILAAGVVVPPPNEDRVQEIITIRDIGNTDAQIVVVLDRRDLRGTRDRAIVHSVAIAALEVLASIAFSLWLVGWLLGPLQELHFASRRIAEGDFSQRLPVVGSDELADTAIAFNTMAARLETQVERMRLDSARRESIETELRVAREIQASLHPATCPLFPGFPRVEVEAIDDPVKEVAGDFYDWFAVDKHRLGIVIADVAGKGVPAGLFAAACLTVIRTLARTGIAPEEVLSRANEHLLEQNREQMFASLVLLHLDVRTGEISAAVAGHPAGRIIRVDGSLERALARTGPILGVIAGAIWERTTCTLNIGDRLVLLTDGAFEARDAKGTMLQDEGVDKLLENLPHATAARTARHIAWAVRRREGENPGDDLTVLVMRRLDEKKPG